MEVTGARRKGSGKGQFTEVMVGSGVGVGRLVVG